MLTGDHKVFLFLQGPHGPFFQRLARMVRHSGADVWRVGFNSGDRLFWQDRDRYVAYRGDAQGWPDFFKTLIAEKRVTDIVLYGDVRPIHAQAIAYAKEARVLLLDEPASGLDPSASNELTTILKQLAAEGATVLMASHDLFRVRETADKIGILKHGMLVEELAADQVSANTLEEMYLQYMKN